MCKQEYNKYYNFEHFKRHFGGTFIRKPPNNLKTGYRILKKKNPIN